LEAVDTKRPGAARSDGVDFVGEHAFFVTHTLPVGPVREIDRLVERDVSVVACPG
jgi:hypothetical protein